MFSQPLRIIRLKSPANTNDAVKEFISKDTCTLLIAEEPLSAKTRNGKSNWKIIKGNLFMSIGVISQTLKIGEIVLRVAVAVGELLSKWIDNLQYKWPNDIMIDGKKVCGILLEYNSGNLVIGIGINVLCAPYSWTTCISEYCSLDLEELPLKIIDSLKKYQNEAIERIISIWKNKALLLGKKITFNSNNEITKGTFIDITEDGALVLREEVSKQQKKFYSGSICIT